jgi:hypothetical protein
MLDRPPISTLGIMHVRSASLVAVVCALLSLQHGVAAARNYSPVAATRTTVVQSPETGKEAQAEVGQTMVTFSRENSTPAIRTSQDVTVHEAVGVQLTVPAGFQYLIGEDGDGKYYEHVGEVVHRSIGVVLEGDRAGLFVPNDPTKPMKTYSYTPFGLRMMPIDRLPFEETTYVAPGTVRFRVEFIYTGCVNNILSATYREFNDDMARPAFTQDLKYDISSDKLIGFRGARIQVLSATNTTITYVVQKGFDGMVQ